MDRKRALKLVDMLRAQMDALADANADRGRCIEIPTRSGNRHARLFWPKEAEGSRPVYIDFHPGGFVSGSPELDSAFNQRVSDELGIVVIAPSYRLAPEAMYPADKEDAIDVVRHIVANADAYGIDPGRMAIGGHSAGGNIAASLALQLKHDPSVHLACVLLDYPALDLYTDARMKPQPEGCINPRMAAAFDSLYRDAEHGRDVFLSPIFAQEDDLRGLAPHIIVTAEGDSLRGEAEEYASRLMAAGVEVMARRFLGVRHGFTIDVGDDEDGVRDARDQAIRFMVRGLGMHMLDG